MNFKLDRNCMYSYIMFFCFFFFFKIIGSIVTGCHRLVKTSCLQPVRLTTIGCQVSSAVHVEDTETKIPNRNNKIAYFWVWPLISPVAFFLQQFPFSYAESITNSFIPYVINFQNFIIECLLESFFGHTSFFAINDRGGLSANVITTAEVCFLSAARDFIKEAIYLDNMIFETNLRR